MANFKFKTMGVMIDMSRNAVMSVEGLKRYLPLLKKMGYNSARDFNQNVLKWIETGEAQATYYGNNDSY